MVIAGFPTCSRHHRGQVFFYPRSLHAIMSDHTIRHFVTYSGIKLPLNLNTPLEEGELRHRITFYRAHYNGAEQMVKVEKVVYGEIESFHEYRYHPGGALQEARIVMVADGECTVMQYAPDGSLLSSETLEIEEES